MSKNYYRNLIRKSATPTTPPSGWVEMFFDEANDGKLTVIRDDGNKNVLGSIGALEEHPHGNITNEGAIGTASGLPLITSTNGVVTTGEFGTDAGDFCEGNDSRVASAVSHIADTTTNPHNITPALISAEPANANIQSHISSTTNPHGVSTTQIGAVAANTAITGATHPKITYDSKGLVTAGAALSASDIPGLDAAKVTSGVFDIARIPAAALERLVQVADQTARYALTTATVQLGDTVKQLDTGIMYVVIDTANLANANGYSAYAAGSAASVPWSGVSSKPTTLTGYGITDAATSTHIHGNITNAGAIGSTANLPLITTTSGVVTVGSFGTAAATFCQGNDSRLSDARTPLSHVHGNITNAGAIGSTASLPIITTTSGVLTTGSFGTAAATFCQGNDSRLSDARTPTAHTHGNITNTGYIGSTAGLPIVTSTSGIVAAGAWYASAGAAATTTGTVGTSTSPSRGDHAHPSRIATSAPASPVNGDIWMV